MAAKAICSIPGCAKRVNCRGWCQMHYTRWQRHGDPIITLTAPDGEGLQFLESLVGSSAEGCIKWPFSCTPQGYGQTYYQGEVMGAHRVMCILAHGVPPGETHQAAHWCGKGADGCVNPNHLRWATPAENIADKFHLHGWEFERDTAGRITGISQN